MFAGYCWMIPFYVNGPDFIVGILHILEAVSKFRSCGGFGRGGCFLDGAVGAYQVGYAIQLCRCIAQVPVCIQAKSLYIDIVVADTVEATALIAAVGVEEPGLVFTEILIVNGLLAGLHDTVIAKVVVCGLAVLGDHALKAGLQLSALIEAKASAVYGKLPVRRLLHSTGVLS